MNYFGVDKRVKVVDKMTPRDIDRSKLFDTKLPPVVKKYEVLLTQDGHNRNIFYHLIKATVWSIDTRWSTYHNKMVTTYSIEATDEQIKLVKLLDTFIKLQEIK